MIRHDAPMMTPISNEHESGGLNLGRSPSQLSSLLLWGIVLLELLALSPIVYKRLAGKTVRPYHVKCEA